MLSNSNICNSGGGNSGSKERKIINLNQYARQSTATAATTAQNRYNTPTETFADAIAKSGLRIDDVPIPDGNIHRFGEDKTCWYVLYRSGDLQAGAYGDWRQSETHKWRSNGGYAGYDQTRMQEMEAQLAKTIEERQRQRKAEQTRAAAIAKRYIEALPKPAANSTTPYLINKKITLVGDVKLDGNTIIIPCFNSAGEIAGLQKILSNGQKLFQESQCNDSIFFPIAGSGQQAEQYAIAEGYSTAASIHLATGWTVIVAFNAGNLPKVSALFRDKKPIVCSDNDYGLEEKGKKNIGIVKAQAAASIYGGIVKTPPAGVKDWNDFWQAHGLSELRKVLMDGITPIKEQIKEQLRNRIIVNDWRSSEVFVGDPPKRQFIVGRTFPIGTASLLASSGGIGKSYMLLHLGYMVADINNIGYACFSQRLPDVSIHSGKAGKAAGNDSHDDGLDLSAPSMAFGNIIPQESKGAVVYLCAEDDRIEVHTRLHGFGGVGLPDYYIIPMPNIRGGKSLFKIDANSKEPTITEEFRRLREQLSSINKLKLLIVDPLQVFALMDLNSAENAQFVMSQLSALASDLNISVLVSHHTRKENVFTLAEARNAIRGSSGIVDGLRCAYAIFPAREADAIKICRDLDIRYAPGRIILGGIVKCNFNGDNSLKTYVRQDNGLLLDRTRKLATLTAQYTKELMMEAYVDIVKDRADQMQPFCRTGANSIHGRKNEAPECLKNLSRRSLQSFCDELLDSGRLVQCILKKQSKTKNILDVPGGPFASGEGEIVAGSV